MAVGRGALPLAILLLAVMPFAGCVAKERVRELWDGFDQTPVYEERELGRLNGTFSSQDLLDPSDPSPNPSARGKRANVTFEVPALARNLTVFVNVTFGGGGGLPIPPSGPANNATVSLVDPTGRAVREQFFDRTGTATFTLGSPSQGTWRLDVRAAGDGSFDAVVSVRAPVSD
ncbi:MAG: hypothetical protein ACT4PT_00515 [Methanobacteriota archaeon]